MAGMDRAIMRVGYTEKLVEKENATGGFVRTNPQEGSALKLAFTD